MDTMTTNDALLASEVGVATSLIRQLIDVQPNVQFYALFLVAYLGEVAQVSLGPILSSFLRVLYRLSIKPLINFVSSALPAEVDRPKSIWKEGAAVPKVESFVESDASNIVKTAKEDMKSLKGNKRDIDYLKAFGYSKHRYVSQSFIRRNHLTVETEEL